MVMDGCTETLASSRMPLHAPTRSCFGVQYLLRDCHILWRRDCHFVCSHSARPSAPLKTMTAPSQSLYELRRLQAKMAFYEEPIVAFDKPIENEPSELDEPRRVLKEKRRMKKTGAKRCQTREERCVLVRFAHRVRELLASPEEPTRQEQRKKKTSLLKRLCGGISKKQGSSPEHIVYPHGFCHHPHLDEATCFRLQLAGLRVQSAAPRAARTQTIHI